MSIRWLKREVLVLLVSSACLHGCDSSADAHVPQAWYPISKFMGMTIPAIYKEQNLAPGSNTLEELRKKVKSDSSFGLSSDLYSINMESSDFKVGFVELSFNATSCTQSSNFEPKQYLKTAGFNFDSLEFVRSKSHVHVFYDHTDKLKVSVMCPYDGGHISVMASQKYYLD